MQSRNLERLKGLTPRLKPLLERYSQAITDLIIFGSFVKDKVSPEDVDVAVITRDRILPESFEKETSEIFDSIGIKGLSKVHLQIIGIEDLPKEPIFLTLIEEGYSVREERFLRDAYDIDPVVLYKYSLGSFSNVKKVQFDRGLKNVLAECVGGEKLSRTVVLIPIGSSSSFEEFLKTWKLEFEKRRFELVGEKRPASM